MESPPRIEELLSHAGWLRRLAASLIADPTSADDLVQDTWVAVLRHPPSHRVLRPWLARVARNLARNRKRSDERRTVREELAFDERSDDGPAAFAEEAEAQRLLAEAVTRLDESSREIIVLRYYRGLDSRAIAGELGLPPSTVRTRLQRGLEELRAELDRRCGSREAWSALLAPLAARAQDVVAATGSLAAAGVVVAGLAGAAVVLGIAVRSWLSEGRETEAASTAISAEAAAPDPGTVAATDASADREALAPSPTPETGGSLAGDTRLDAGVELSGTILVDGQAPRWPLELMLVAGSAPETPTSLTLLPEQLGAFSFGSLPADWNGRLQVLDHLFQGDHLWLEIERPTSGLVLNVRSLPAITGRFLDARGAPLGSVTVQAEWDVAHDGEYDENNWRELATTADGRFRVPYESAGEHAIGTLLVEADDRAYARVETPQFGLETGIDLGDVIAEPVRRISFSVRNPAGAPVAGAFARIGKPLGCAEVGDFRRRSEPTAGDGSGTLPFAPERDVPILVSAFRYADRELVAEAGRSAEVTLEPLASLEVRITGAGAKRVVVRSEGSPYVWDDLDASAPAQLQFGLGASKPKRRTLSKPRQECEYVLPDDGRLLLVGLRPDLVLELDVQDDAGRSLAVRTASVGAGEWAALEIPLAP